MSTKEIIRKLEKMFETKKGVEALRVDAIETLLDKLEKKKRKFQARLDGAETSKMRIKAERKLAVCNAQLSKGHTVIEELRNGK